MYKSHYWKLLIEHYNIINSFNLNVKCHLLMSNLRYILLVIYFMIKRFYFLICEQLF
jgi:hypothetical protein